MFPLNVFRFVGTLNDQGGDAVGGEDGEEEDGVEEGGGAEGGGDEDVGRLRSRLRGVDGYLFIRGDSMVRHIHDLHGLLTSKAGVDIS